MGQNVAIERLSFAAGEVSPLLRARSDLVRNQTGIEKCVNFAVMVEGGITRMPGTRFVWPLKDEAQQALLMPFEFSKTDTYMLVFNAGVMRVMRNGGIVESAPGVPYELSTGYVEADLPNIRYAQNGNIIFLACAGKKPRVITRLGHTSWTIEDYTHKKGPVQQQNLDEAKTITTSGQTGTVTLTANFSLFQAGHVGSIWRLDEKDLSVIPAYKTNEAAANLPHGTLRRNRGNIYRVDTSTDVTAGVYEGAGPNAPQHEEGLYHSGQKNTIWAFDSSASGYVRITAVASATSATAEVISKVPQSALSTYRWFAPEWSDATGWPTQVLLYDNRLIWARGNKVWMTTLGDFYDFAIISTDDSAIAISLSSSEGKLVDIAWLLNSGVVVAGTDSSEWTIRGKEAFATITLATIRAIPSGTEGSSSHRPLAIDGGVVFIGRSRDRLHFAQFDPLNENVKLQELTLFSKRILDAGAYGLAYQRDPHRLVWIRKGDGTLSCVTFRPDQDVVGWARRTMTNGFIEDISAIPSPDASRSEVWMVVRRTINGVTRRYVEVMQPFFTALNVDAPTAESAWFVDSGLERRGNDAVTTISGLEHLIGQEVVIFCDGVQHVNRTVSSTGTITLDYPAKNVLVGLPITAIIRTLPLHLVTQNGSGRGNKKAVRRVAAELFEAKDGFFSGLAGQSTPISYSGAATLGGAQPLDGGIFSLPLIASPDMEPRITITTSGAYPFTLLGFSAQLELTER